MTSRVSRSSKGLDPELFAPASVGNNNNNAPSYSSTVASAGATITSTTPYKSSIDPRAYNQSSASHRHHPTTQQFATIELEHISGYTGKGKNTIHAHPMDPDTYITCMGASVVIGNVREVQNQELLRGHDEEINMLAVSSSGTFIASSQMPSRRRKEIGASIVIWDLTSRQLLYQLIGFQRPVLRMTFSPDEHFLIATAEDSKIILWDMRTSEMVLTKSFPTPVTVVNWGRVDEKCRRPKYTLTLAHSAQLILGELAYDISGMQYKMELFPFHMPNIGLTRNYLCASMSQPKTDLLAGTIAGELVVFNTETQVYRNTIPVSRNGVHSMVTCPITGFVFVGAGDGLLKKLVGKDSDWNLVGQVQLVGSITGLSISSDGNRMYAGTSAGKIYHILVNTLMTTEISSSHLEAITSCAFGESSEEFATISTDGTVRLWDLSSYLLKGMSNVENCIGLSIAYTKKTSLLITGWADGWVRAFDARDASKKWHIANAHRGEVTCIATSDTFFVTGSSDGGVNVWNVQTRELMIQFHEHKRGGVTQVLVDITKPHWIHSCGLDRALFIYDLKLQRRIVAQQTREGGFNGITQRLDSETEIITAGSDGRLLMWDCDIAEPVQMITDPNRLKLSSASVSPSGRFLATCGEDCEVKIYDVRSSVLLMSALGHSQIVNQIVWSPDERQLISVGSDSCICVWNFYLDEN